MKKKLLCLLLAFVMLLTVLTPVAATNIVEKKGIGESKTESAHDRNDALLAEKLGRPVSDPAENPGCVSKDAPAPSVTNTRSVSYDYIQIYDYCADANLAIGETYSLDFVLTAFSSAYPSRYHIEIYNPSGTRITSTYGSFPTYSCYKDVSFKFNTSGRAKGAYEVVFYPDYYYGGSYYIDYDYYFHTYVYLNPASGKCGPNLSWKFDGPTNTLKITGSGDMYNYNWETSHTEPDFYPFCDRCSSISFPSGLTSIGSEAFWFFTNIYDVDIPSNVTIIADRAFACCSNLEFVYVPEKVSCICDSAFACCEELYGIEVANRNCKIYQTLDYGYTLGVPYYTSIYCYPYSTEETYANEFGFDITYLCDGGKCGDNLDWMYDPYSNTLYITGFGDMYDYNNYNNPAPWKIYANDCEAIDLDYKVTSISVCAFNGFSKVPSITIPQNCTYIDDFAFLNCSSMVKASFVTATHIGHNALAGCSSLKDTYVFIPDCEIIDTAKTGRTLGVPGYTTVHGYTGSTAYAYAKAYGYNFVSMGSIKATGKAGDNLTWTYDPETKELSITGFGDMYDYNNYNNPAPWKVYADECTSISLDYKMTRISVCAFLGFEKVPSITIPQNCTYIDDFAFLNCSSMVKASFVTATHIGHNALANCSKLKDTYVFIPDCEIIDTAGSGRTLGVPGYTTVHGYTGSTAEAYAKTYGYSFVSMGTVKATGKAGDNLTWTYDPDTKELSITGFGDMYDYNNYNNPAPWKVYADECTSISLDYKMTRISVCAFLGFEKVPSITIPMNCTYIDDFAFLNCSSMVKASFVTATHIGHNALANCSSLRDTYVFIPNCEIIDTAKTGRTLGVPGYTTIHGYYGSTAETYAKTYGYTFVVIPGDPPATTVTASVALVTDIADIDDESFNQACWEGINEAAAKYNWKFSYFKPTEDTTAARISAIKSAINAGYDTIVVPGFLFGEVLVKVQNQYPDVRFIGLDIAEGDFTIDYENYPSAASNTTCITYREEQAGYLAGYAAVAEGYTKLGFLGGMEIPAVMRYGYGYLQGANAAAKELGKSGVSVRFGYCGQFFGDANVTAKMKQWYGSGTQVIMACGGGVYTSVCEAAEVYGRKVIGIDVDQTGTFDAYDTNISLTSAMKNLAGSVSAILTAIHDNKWSEYGGKFRTLGLQDGPCLCLSTASWRFRTFTQTQYNSLLSGLANGSRVCSSDINSKPYVPYLTVSYGY